MPLSALLLVFVTAASGQVSTGTLTGLVNDASQARLPNVTLRLTNEETGVAVTAATNVQGEYTFPLLASGRYRLNAEARGFQNYTRSGIVLELGRVSRLDITLQVGQVSESIEVAGTAPLLDSETSSVGQFIENKTIADMPLNGRRVGELLGLMGSAVFIGGDVIRPRVSVAGGRGDQQQWLLDGVNSSNIALEIPQALFNPPVEAVQEIRVHQNNYSAEFGNTSGGVVTVTTRSGTNQYHGVLYEYFRNDKLDARNFFAATRPPLRWNMFGGAAGGPLIRNRTFFFSHIEFQRQRIGIVRLLTVPTELERRGDFSRTTTAAGAPIPVYDPDTTRPDPANPSRLIRTAFAGNVIPASRQDPVGARLAAFSPPSNRPATNLAGANNFVANASNALNITTWTSKGDHIFSERDRISVRYVMHDFPTYSTTVYPETAADPNGNTTSRRAHSLLLNELHNFTPTIVNDFRLNWQPRRFQNLSLGLDQGWPAKLGLKGVSDRAFPRVDIAGYAPIGPGTAERIQIPIHDTHIVNNVSIFRGAHSLRLGGELRLARNVDDLNTSISGQMSFGVQPTAQPGVNNTGNALASLLVGFPNSGSVLDTDILDRRAKYIALFVQDDWKLSAKLTLNAGLRWETHTPRFDANDRQNGFDLFAINPASATPGVITFAGRDGVGRNVYNGDYNNFAPRFGVAWKPFAKTVVRAGYGVFFGVPLPGSNNTSAGYETSGSFTTPDNGITSPFLLRNGFPETRVRPELGPGFGAVPVGQPIRFAPQFVDPDRRLGYSQQWNLNVQRDLGAQMILDLSYLGNGSHGIPGPDTNMNQVRPGQMGAGNAQIRRPFPQFGNVTRVSPMWGNSSYHSFNAKVEKRFSGGLNFLANYTIAKFIDDVPAQFEVGAVGGGMQNYYDRRAEKSLSGNDVRHRLVGSGVYELPFGRRRKWLSSGASAVLLGGWNVGAILTLQAGSPDALVTQVNGTNAFNPGGQRVNVLSDPNLPSSGRSVSRWFDTAAVVAPPQFTFGNSGRALVTSPGIVNIDLSLLKNFATGDRWNVQFRTEAFNLPNHANFEDPGRALGAATFGVISESRPARNLQLGLKVTF
ncbi:MAG: TonB-dependent receptor [Acidobacteria bacterium]|nr:TonB-dependent receptor [Acidobacteriota bacterium]